MEVRGRSQRVRGLGSEHVHADLSVALGTCESSHLDTVGSKGDCLSLGLSWGPLCLSMWIPWERVVLSCTGSHSWFWR